MDHFMDNMNKDLKLSNDIRWSILDKLYDRNYANREEEHLDYNKIPKIIHQIWLGGDIPDQYHYYIDNIKNKNPNWKHMLWTDNDVDNFGLKNINLYKNINNLGSKSDIFRYEILERYGGIYLDTDFYGVKSFDDFTYLDFFAGTGQSPNPEVYNGLIGTIPNSKIISNCVNELLKISHFNDYVGNVMKVTGPYFLENVFYNTINDNDKGIVIFPTMFFYPFPGDKRFIARDNNYIKIINSYNTDKTYCVHMWHTSWQK